MARFLVDESLPERVREELNAIGHEAVHAYDVGLAGAPDQVIFSHALSEKRIIITLDLGFGELAFGRSVGTVIVRARKRIDIDELIREVMRYLVQFAAELEGKVLVIEPGRGRLRPRARDHRPE